LMARGRDAIDVAIATTFGPNTLVSFKVCTDETHNWRQAQESAGLQRRCRIFPVAMSLTVRERNAPRPSDVVFDLAVGRPVLKEGLRRVRLFFGKLVPMKSRMRNRFHQCGLSPVRLK
jgi:hypothetical protein